METWTKLTSLRKLLKKLKLKLIYALIEVFCLSFVGQRGCMKVNVGVTFIKCGWPDSEEAQHDQTLLSAVLEKRQHGKTIAIHISSLSFRIFFSF